MASTPRPRRDEAMEDTEDPVAPGSSGPGSTTPEPPAVTPDPVERQRPPEGETGRTTGREDEAADPVGDGHSDADLAQSLPPR
jgi:hypothetical protein